MDPLGTQSQTGKTNVCNKHMLCAMHEIQTRFHFIHLHTTYLTSDALKFVPNTVVKQYWGWYEF